MHRFVRGHDAFIQTQRINRYVEEDGYVSFDVPQAGATWGLDRIDRRNLRFNTTRTRNTAAVGVHVYIIDTCMLATHNEYGGGVGNGFDADGGGANAAGSVPRSRIFNCPTDPIPSSIRRQGSGPHRRRSTHAGALAIHLRQAIEFRLAVVVAATADLPAEFGFVDALLP